MVSKYSNDKFVMFVVVSKLLSQRNAQLITISTVHLDLSLLLR
jgi:hypothetical protein